MSKVGKCPACSSEAIEDAQFCHKCGSPLEPSHWLTPESFDRRVAEFLQRQVRTEPWLIEDSAQKILARANDLLKSRLAWIGIITGLLVLSFSVWGVKSVIDAKTKLDELVKPTEEAADRLTKKIDAMNQTLDAQKPRVMELETSLNDSNKSLQTLQGQVKVILDSWNKARDRASSR